MATRPNQTSPVVRAGIYTRISWDPAGQRAGVERQRVDCEALCADRGWEIAHYFEDNDRSAYGRNRPAYEGLLAAVEERRLGAVVTWHNDRLHRSPRELGPSSTLWSAGACGWRWSAAATTTSRHRRGVSRPASSGRWHARSRRIAAAGSGASTSSWPNRAGRRATSGGACATTLSVSWCGRAAGRILAGQGLITIARDWNRRALPGTTASPWTAPTLRKILLSARIAGLREHGADPRGRVLGALTPAVWEGAIDRPTWDHVRAVLLNPERLTLGNTPTKYLLVGVIFCGMCGGRMFSRPRDDHTKRYVCAGRRPGHQLTIVAQPVDDLVARRVLELLTTPAFRDAVLARSGPSDEGSLGRALAALGSAQSRMQILDDEYYVRGAVGHRRYRSIRTRLEREVERLHSQVDRESKQRIVLHPDPRRLWTDADFGQRRELVRLVIKRVRVMPAGRGARFDPARVQLDIPLLDVVASGRAAP
jgi:site-specific DNA recombinase